MNDDEKAKKLKDMMSVAGLHSKHPVKDSSDSSVRKRSSFHN